MKRTKQVPIYIICKYADNKFPAPEVFFRKGEYNARFRELVNGLDSGAYIDMPGKEASLLSQDTLYGGLEATIPADTKDLYLYCEMENDECFMFTKLATMEDREEAYLTAREFIGFAQRCLAEHAPSMDRYGTALEINADPRKDTVNVRFHTEGDSHGSVQYAAALTRIQIDNNNNKNTQL